MTWLGNKRLGRVEVQERVWTVSWNFTLDNYKQVLGGQNLTFTHADGTVEVVPGDNMVRAFVNSLSVAIPSTVIPILIAAFAAYAFAWMEFPGRREMFIVVVALQVVPLQIALVPILRDYKALNLNGTFLGIWLSHTGFGLALATYLLYSYISSLPREILESAYIDGASHFTAFTQLVLPLSVPALASFAIFQFNWVWNDYLVALIFLGGNPEFELVTQRMAAIVGARGQDWHLLTAGAFVSMVLPLDGVLCTPAILLARLAGRFRERMTIRHQVTRESSWFALDAAWVAWVRLAPDPGGYAGSLISSGLRRLWSEHSDLALA